MSSNLQKSSTSPKTTDSFLFEWSKRKLPTLVHEYGGERAGVPKGEDIPFPPHKVKAAVALLAYGAPKFETLTAIARTVRVSSALLRVWRTEERFLSLYRRAVWECADDFLPLLAANWEHGRPSPSAEFQLFFGVALQEAILRRLCVDVIHMVPDWMPSGLKPKWLSECTLVDPPSNAPPSFSREQTRFMTLNTHMLLAVSFLRLGTRDPSLAHGIASLLVGYWAMRSLTKHDLRVAVEKGSKEEALNLIEFITQLSPIDDLKKLHGMVSLVNTGKRKR